MKNEVKILLTLLLLTTQFTVFAQARKGIAMIGKVQNGDTILLYNLPEVRIYEIRTFRNKSERRRYDRLVYNVKKVYPYAKMAMNLLDEYNKQLTQMEKDRERKKYLNRIEKELFSKYKNEIEDLTITQGRILIKLIDRQTGQSSYKLIKDYRGTFPAYFWQSIALLFGTNLKAKYDAKGEDQMIEDIVLLIESGQI